VRFKSGNLCGEGREESCLAVTGAGGGWAWIWSCLRSIDSAGFRLRYLTSLNVCIILVLIEHRYYIVTLAVLNNCALSSSIVCLEHVPYRTSTRVFQGYGKQFHLLGSAERRHPYDIICLDLAGLIDPGSHAGKPPINQLAHEMIIIPPQNPMSLIYLVYKFISIPQFVPCRALPIY